MEHQGANDEQHASLRDEIQRLMDLLAQQKDHQAKRENDHLLRVESLSSEHSLKMNAVIEEMEALKLKWNQEKLNMETEFRTTIATLQQEFADEKK